MAKQYAMVKHGDRPNLWRRGDVFWFKGMVNGKLQRYSLHTKDEREANLKLSVEESKPKHKRVSNRTIKCKEAFDNFIANGHGAKRKLAPSTKKLYEELWLLYAVLALGNMRVIDVTPQHIIDVLDKAKLPVEQGGYGLSPTRHRNLYVALQSFFKKLTKTPFEYTSYDPVAHIGDENVPPKVESDVVDNALIFTEYEVDAIAAAFKQPPKPTHGRGGNGRFKDSEWLAVRNRMIWLLLVYTGLRIGEALALEWSNVIYLSSGGTLHKPGELPHVLDVTKQRNTEYRASDPMSEPFAPLKGRLIAREGRSRRIPIGPFLARELAAYIEYAQQHGHLYNGGLLFPNTVGKMSTSGHVGEAIKAAAKHAGITRPIKTHFTRHTYISDLIERNVDDAKISEYTGDGAKVINERYGHRNLDSASYAETKAAMRQ